MSDRNQFLKAAGLAVGLPSSILGIFAGLYYLINEGFISPLVAGVIISLFIFYTFYLMIRYANKK